MTTHTLSAWVGDFAPRLNRSSAVYWIDFRLVSRICLIPTSCMLHLGELEAVFSSIIFCGKVQNLLLMLAIRFQTKPEVSKTEDKANSDTDLDVVDPQPKEQKMAFYPEANTNTSTGGNLSADDSGFLSTSPQPQSFVTASS